MKDIETSNVVDFLGFKTKKQETVQKPHHSNEDDDIPLTPAEEIRLRVERIKGSIERINAMMAELKGAFYTPNRP